MAGTLLLVVPAAVPNPGLLDALRFRLLPVPARTLVAVRMLVGAPLRLALVPPVLAAGAFAVVRDAGSRVHMLAEGAALAGWMAAALTAGTLLDLAWARPGWCAGVVRGAAYGLLALPARPPHIADAGSSVRRHVRLLAVTQSPTHARELALLTRHSLTRNALAGTALVTFVASYGRVPGLAVGILLAWLAPLGNALGPDLALGGHMRHHLLPLTNAEVRDHRLAVWGIAAALAAGVGAALALVLPAPNAVARPAAGALAAPALALYVATVLPHLGRASWWLAVRYPQSTATRGVGAAHNAGVRAEHPGRGAPIGAAVAALVAWTGVGLGTAVLLAITTALATTVSRDPGVVWYLSTAISAGVTVALFVLTSPTWARARVDA